MAQQLKIKGVVEQYRFVCVCVCSCVGIKRNFSGMPKTSLAGRYD